jgi:hypothetical protein
MATGLRISNLSARHALWMVDTPESRKAFEEKYGTDHKKRIAFGTCVSQQVDAKP